MTISPANVPALEPLADVDPDLWDAMQGERRRPPGGLAGEIRLGSGHAQGAP